jgi:uncharacterized protein (TIGR00725 family)
MPPPSRRLVVGVIGSGSEDHRAAAEAVGALLANLGVHLLTGGGRGVMAAVSRAFAETPGRAGLVIGVLPCLEGDPTRSKEGYPNEWIEIVIPTHLPLSGERGTEPMSRNHINVLASNAVIALPGGPGTASEAELAVRYGRPILAFLESPGQIPGLPTDVPVVCSLGEVETFLRSALGLVEGMTPFRDKTPGS